MAEPLDDGLASTIVIEEGGKLTETTKKPQGTNLSFTVEYRKISDKKFEVFQQTVKGSNGQAIEIEPYEITWIDDSKMMASVDSIKLLYVRNLNKTHPSASSIGIWKFKNPNDSFFLFDEELLSQAFEIKADGWFIFTYLTKTGKLYEYEGRWKKTWDLKFDFEPRNFNLPATEKITGELLDAETFELRLPNGRKAPLVRVTTDTVDYPATEAEKQKYVGVWKAKKSSSPVVTSELQTLNADGTAIYEETGYKDRVTRLEGTWKLVSTDVVVITRKNVVMDGHFKCIGKLTDKDTLDLERATTNTIFKRK
jgi:hypothetical protein